MPDADWKPLAQRSDADRRMTLAFFAKARYAEGSDAQRQVFKRLWDNHLWAPTPDDCPVPWRELDRWYNQVPRLRVRRETAERK